MGRRRIVGPFTARQLLAIASVAALVAILATVANVPIATIGSDPAPPDPRATPYLVGEAREGLRPGELAPELTATRADGSTVGLVDLDGRPVTLAALRGKAVWIDFWASWCPPCQAETPVLRDAYAIYRARGLEIVAISVQESSVDDVRAYAERYRLPYTVAADLGGDLFRAYRVYALPTQFFIDPDGVIRRVVQGPMTAASAAAAIEEILP